MILWFQYFSKYLGTRLNVLFVVTTSIQFVARQYNIGNITIDECLAMIGFSRNILHIYLIQKGNSAINEL